MFLQDPSVENEVHSPILGRRSISNDTRLQGKHFTKSQPPKRGRCGCCGYKKGINGKNKHTELQIILENVTNFSVKPVLNHIIQEAMCK